MPQVESTITSAKRPTWSIVTVLLLVIVIGVMVGLLILKFNRELQLKAQVSGLQQELTQKLEQPAASSQTIIPSSPSIPSTPSLPSSPSLSLGPSQPKQTHKVEKGETLFAIGQKYNVEWTSIVKANGLADENLIKAGDLLVVPTIDVKAGISQVDFSIDQEKSKIIQSQATSNQAWRLDPVEVAKKEGSGVYGLTVNDNWVLGSKNSETGVATVRVAREDEQYEVNLVQPVEKGEQGIWAITAVKSVK